MRPTTQAYKTLEFDEGDKGFLKVSPMQGVNRISRKRKLGPRYVGPFEILGKIGPVAYRLVLPPEMEKIHNVVHVLNSGNIYQIPITSSQIDHFKLNKICHT